MKRSLPVAALLCLAFVFNGCLKDSVKRTYTIKRPVLGLKQDVYANITPQTPQPVTAPGKMFLMGQYIYLTEQGKGIHVIDRSNPSQLVNVSFIPIPDNQDVAVKDNVLYADCATDLLVIDVSQPASASFVKFLPNVFPDKSYNAGYHVDSNHVIVDWIVKDTMIYEKDAHLYQPLMFEDFFAGGATVNSTSGGGSTPAPGIAGSTSRFAVVNDYLYTVSTSTLKSFNAADPTNPSEVSSQVIGWNIETIYPFRNNLFIGSASAMFIYGLNNPANPQHVSTFGHATQCDPVIADDKFAYVTLRDGTTCQGFNNQLDVIDIDNLSSPVLVKTLPLTNPRGLSKDDDLLFICDGPSGLRILNASDPAQTAVAQTIPMSPPNDVIAWDGIAYVVADDGLYRFDYSGYPQVNAMGKLVFSK